MYESQLIEPIDFSSTDDPFEISGDLLHHIFETPLDNDYEDYEDNCNNTTKQCTIVKTAIKPVDVPTVPTVADDAATNMYGNGKQSFNDDDISQIASPVSTFDRDISEKYICTPLSLPIIVDSIFENLYSSGRSSSSRISNSGESNHDVHINDAQLAYGVQNSYEQPRQPGPTLNSSPNNVLQDRLHKDPSTKRKQQRNQHELPPRRRRKLLRNSKPHERKNVSLRCHIRKCLSALEDAKSLSRTVQNEAMLNFVSTTMKQTRYDFMQKFGYEIDNYCLPTLRSQCTVYKDTIGETCTVVYRSTSIIKVETHSGAILEFRREQNEWWNQNSGQVLSY